MSRTSPRHARVLPRHRLLGRVAATTAVAGALLAGVATATARPAQALTPTRGDLAVQIASTYAGTPYLYGGNTPGGFDCSGFTQWVMGRLGWLLPRTAEGQMLALAPVAPDQARPGDLVYFVDGDRAYHAALYAGDGYIYDSPSAGGVVSERRIWTTSVVYRRAGVWG